jgi:hypothetical protein
MGSTDRCCGCDADRYGSILLRHVDADPDPACHFDPDPTFHSDAVLDPSFLSK